MTTEIDLIEKHISKKRKKEMELENVKNKILGYINDLLRGSMVNNIDFLNKLIKKYGAVEALKAIDLSAEKYLRFSENGHDKASIEIFMNKIGGIIVNNNRPIVDSKCSYIKAIARNNFTYWNERAASITLVNYTKALRDYGWTESRILHDLESEVQPKTISSRNWSEWMSLMEKWTADIKNWENK